MKMAAGSEFAFISNSDEKILKALSLAEDIRKESDLSYVQANNNVRIKLFENDLTFGDTECVSSSVGESTKDSVFSASDSEDPISLCNSFKCDSEYEAVCRDMQTLDKMCDMFIERNQLLKSQNDTFMKDTVAPDQEMLSENILKKRLEQINDVIMHIITMANQMCRIQQVLQDKPWENTLKVDPSCQKAVIKFFQIANEVIKDIQEQAEYFGIFRKKSTIEGYGVDDKELQSKLHNIILGLAKRIDIISRFRDNVSSLFDPESAFSSKSQLHQPRSISDSKSGSSLSEASDYA